MINNNQRSQPPLPPDLFHHITAPVLELDSQPESPASAAQSYGALLPPVLGLLRVWGRWVTQTVWGDDICPVRREGGMKEESERRALTAEILCFSERADL